MSLLSRSESKAFTLSFLTWLIYCQMTFLWKDSSDLGTGSKRQRRCVRMEGRFEERSKLSRLSHLANCAALHVCMQIVMCGLLQCARWSVFEVDVMTCTLFTIHNHDQAKHRPFLLGPFLHQSHRLLLRAGHLAQTLNHSYVNLPMTYQAQCHRDSLLIPERSLHWITVTS